MEGTGDGCLDRRGGKEDRVDPGRRGQSMGIPDQGFSLGQELDVVEM
jgi:hypothetical protein